MGYFDEAESSDPREENVTNRTTRVLVVEDDRGDYLLTQECFRDLGRSVYELYWAKDYEAGMAALHDRPFEVCLVDYRLGAKDGLDFIRDLTAEGFTQPKILLTGMADPRLDRQALESGAADYIEKANLSGPVLDRAIRYAINRAKILHGLHESEELLRCTLEALRADMAILEPEGRCIAINHVAGEDTYWRTNDCIAFIDDNFIALLEKTAKEPLVAVAEGIRKVAAGTSEMANLEYSSGEGTKRRWYSTWIKRFYACEDLRILVTNIDITGRVVLEEQLRQSQKMDAVGRLAGSVAHDFNNLLTVILGYSDSVLRKMPDDHLFRKSIEAIKVAGSRAAKLTCQLLTMSRKQVVEIRTLDVNLIIGGIADVLRRLAGNNIAVAINTCPGPARVEVDQSQLEQVLINLVVNARDAMPHGGGLMISTSHKHFESERACWAGLPGPGEYVAIEVRDSGVGMDEATKSQMFEPFFTTKEVGKGTGLGLSIVYGVVKQNNGAIIVESALGVGTTMRVLLPASSAARAIADAPPLARNHQPEGLVCVVEDSHAVRDLVSEVLQQSGFKVITAANAGMALHLMAQQDHPPDLLLTDVVMPGISGAALAKKLRAKWPSLRVLFMSAHVAADSSDTPELKAAEFIQKPFDPSHLVERIYEILDESPTREASEECLA